MGDPKIVERGRATRFTSGNAPKGGRQKGARDKLSRDFIDALSEAFADGGMKAIEEVRDKDPGTFLRALVALQPKEVEHKIEPEGDMTDDRLSEVYDAIQSELVKRKSNATVN